MEQYKNKPTFFDMLATVGEYNLRKNQQTESNKINKFNMMDKAQNRRDVAGANRAGFVLKLAELKNTSEAHDLLKATELYEAELVKEAVKRKISPTDIAKMSELDKELTDKGLKEAIKNSTRGNRDNYDRIAREMQPIIGGLNEVEQGKDEFATMLDIILNGGK